MGTADGRVRTWVTVVVTAMVAAAVVVASLDLTGRLPGGLVTDRPAPAPAAPPRDPRPVAAPEVLEPQPGPSASSVPGLAVAALDAALGSGPLGPDPAALVIDVASGTVLLDRSGAVPRTPASLAKLATGAAALVTLDPLSRLRTAVVRGSAAGEVVLVGGGDATLTTQGTSAARAGRRPGQGPGRPPGRGPGPSGPGVGYPPTASLAALADATAVALLAAGTSTVALRVDDSLFGGPVSSPDWPATYVGSGVVAPVSALSADAGRVRPGADARHPDPALAAGRAFARLLRARGVGVATEVARGAAPVGGDELAAVTSPTVAQLVELMLTTSDNDLAESLLRLVAVGAGREGTFEGGTEAVRQVLVGLGLPTDGTVLLDGSGLARGSTIAPETLARLLVAAADGSRPRLAPLVTGLPVAGWSGTLAERFGGDAGAGADATGGAGRGEDPGRAAGLVRAKTGTLTGVSTLAGVAPATGRPVAFVVMSDGVRAGPRPALAARTALDRFAATLSGGGGGTTQGSGG